MLVLQFLLGLAIFFNFSTELNWEILFENIITCTFFVPTSDVSREFFGVLLVSKITSFSVTHSTRPHSGGRDFENVLI